MTDKCFQVSVGALINLGLWGLGAAVILAACFGYLAHSWSDAGLALIIFGCLRQGCWLVRKQHRPISEAFELGRESMRLVGR